MRCMSWQKGNVLASIYSGTFNSVKMWLQQKYAFLNLQLANPNVLFQHLQCGDVGNCNGSSAHSTHDMDRQSNLTRGGKVSGQPRSKLLPDARHLLDTLTGNLALHATNFTCRKFASAYSELHAKMVSHLRSLRPKPSTSPSVAHVCKVFKGCKAPPLLRVKV